MENITKRTLLLDESDNLFTSRWDRNTMTAVINDGYLRGGHVLHKGAITPVFGPLALAGIENGPLPQATRTRTIPIQMRKPPAGSPQPESYDPFDHEDFGIEMRLRLADSAQHWTRVQAPHTLREGQLWTPLHSIATAAGGDWLDRVKTAAAEHTWTRSYSRENAALKSSREWFSQFPEADRVQSSVLADYINASQDRFTVSLKGLAGIMQGYQVEPHKISVMYYLGTNLEPVWAEWLPKAA